MNVKKNVWIRWSEASKNILFKSNVKGVGDGEMKLCSEYKVTPLGQNSSHDIEVNNVKYECKKLDTDNSFRLGVTSQKDLIQISKHIVELFDSVKSLSSLLIDDDVKTKIDSEVNNIHTVSGRSKFSLYEGVLRSEISGTNLKKLNNVISNIVDITKESKNICNNNMHHMYDPLDGYKKLYSADKVYGMLKLNRCSDKVVKKKLSTCYNHAVIAHICNIEHFANSTVMCKLNNTVRRIFTDVTLVIVDEQRGYKLVTDTDKLVCARITNKTIRCMIV